MSDTTDEETSEAEAPEGEKPFRARDVFQFRRLPKNTGEAAAGEPEEEPEAESEDEPKIPPEPKDPPPVAAPGRSDGGHRIPNWWEPKASLSSDEDAARRSRAAVGTVKWINGVPHHVPPVAETCEHPNPHEVRAKPTNELVAYWCSGCETQLEVPDEYDELEGISGDEGEEGDDEPADEVPSAVRRRWGVRGTGEKTYKRPVFGKDSAGQKKSLIEAFTEMQPKTKHLLYNGTALGAGFYLGVPQFFTAEVAYLAATYDSWTDFYVAIWYGVAAGITVLDYRTRGWFPLFSWATRIPLVSMIVGALYYGIPAA
ncbi:hypothetical protein ACIQZO_35050 [Streptomyces sp. NPDC097617]|uniref:hypothetical protein n=1 Tax=Streptomyces sp. NPDC097617 TaxID=3366091 RepID=UPI003814520B